MAIQTKLLIIYNKKNELEFEKFFEIQKSFSKSVVYLYLNSAEFCEFNEEYENVQFF